MKRRWSVWGGGKHQRLARTVVTAGLASGAAGSGELIDPELYRSSNLLEDDPEVETLLELWSLGLLSAVVLCFR